MLDAERDLVSHRCCAGIGKALGANAYLRLAIPEVQPNGVLTRKQEIEIANAMNVTGSAKCYGVFAYCRVVPMIVTDCAEGGRVCPDCISNFEFLPGVQLDVQIIGIAAVLKSKIVQRSPVVHGPAQK